MKKKAFFMHDTNLLTAGFGTVDIEWLINITNVILLHLNKAMLTSCSVHFCQETHMYGQTVPCS